MPARQNEIDGALILEFGFGDLVIGSAHLPGRPEDELVIWPKQPGPIGDLNIGDVGKTTVDVNALVRMVFKDSRSLDVLIHQAQELRALMVGQHWTPTDHGNLENPPTEGKRGRFRKRPVVIDAVQFWYGEPEIDGVVYPPKSEDNRFYIGDAYIETLEGKMYISNGDWIITGVKGEKYPCKPDIFAATYEAV